MDIRYTILGFLNWKPLSGYDLKKMIARSDLFYWSGNNNQIYTALTQLHKEGFVSQEVKFQESLPARKIYSVTDTGRREFALWLQTAPEPPETHNHFMIQLAWANDLSDTELDGLLERYEEEVEIQLRMKLEDAARPADRPDRTRREEYIWRQIEKNIAEPFRLELEWVRQLRRGLQNRVYEK